MARHPDEALVYVILGSHACRAGTLMLEHKGIPYRTRRLPSGLHQLIVPRLGFEGPTLPAIRMDGRRIQTNRTLARVLDELRPEPPLFPADPDARRAVEEAEALADEKLQMTARRLTMAGAFHDDVLIDRAAHGRLGPLLFHRDAVRMRMMRVIGRRAFAVDLDAEKRLLERIPGMLDRVDAWVEDGTLNGEALNAADFQIAPSVALLTYRRDLVDDVARRPVQALIDRVLPAPD